uniref:Uncharacterized protein n=1 Tax=Nelumbo nucifera TaxID=4432 RepID=A0A823A0H0_NELNU|nr:TPA_asm: hypothetical protein HUJ06_018483 [Nelumbo nucifera]
MNIQLEQNKYPQKVRNDSMYVLSPKQQ